MDLSPLTHPELRALHLEAVDRGDAVLAAQVRRCLAEREETWRDPEPLDVYDDALVHRGVKERGLVHLDGDWHRSFHCWLFSSDRGSLLAQRRAESKRTYPGRLDTSVAGHYRAGEGVAEGCREAEEELGLTLDPAGLIPLGRSVDMARHGVLLDREVADIFLYNADVAPHALRPDPKEVATVVEFRITDAVDLFCAGRTAIPAREYGPAAAGTEVSLRLADFTHHHDAYYARLALQVSRAADGLPPLPL